jgi:hypothetical protein
MAHEKTTCQRARKGEEKREILFTECEYNVEDFFVCQFGRDGISIGGGGGSRGPGKLLGNNWDGHRGEGNDDDEQIEARPEERFGDPLREGHDLVVLVVFEMKRVSYKEGLRIKEHQCARMKPYIPVRGQEPRTYLRVAGT